MLFSMGLMQKGKCVLLFWHFFLKKMHGRLLLVTSPVSFALLVHQSRENGVAMYLLNWTILSLWLLQYAFRLNELSFKQKVKSEITQMRWAKSLC